MTTKLSHTLTELFGLLGPISAFHTRHKGPIENNTLPSAILGEISENFKWIASSHNITGAKSTEIVTKQTNCSLMQFTLIILCKDSIERSQFDTEVK